MANNCFDLMARGNSHCCHHMGILKYYPEYVLYLHNSSNLKIANSHYNGAKFKLNNVKFLNTLFLYLRTIKSLLFRDTVLFAGLHLKQAVLLLPMIVFNGRVTIHLHGQAHGLKRKFLKYALWRLISFFATLEVGNPAWIGPSFVNIIKNINEIYHPVLVSGNNNVLFYSAIGKKPTELLILKQKLEEKNLVLIIAESGISYEALDQLFRSANYIYLDYCGDYYSYSPCGHISDAICYGLTLVLNFDDFLNISVVKKYPVNYILA